MITVTDELEGTEPIRGKLAYSPGQDMPRSSSRTMATRKTGAEWLGLCKLVADLSLRRVVDAT